MSGRVNGRGRIRVQGVSGRGRGTARGKCYSGATSKHKIVCDTLGNYLFDFSQKASAGKMCTTW